MSIQIMEMGHHFTEETFHTILLSDRKYQIDDQPRVNRASCNGQCIHYTQNTFILYRCIHVTEPVEYKRRMRYTKQRQQWRKKGRENGRKKRR